MRILSEFLKGINIVKSLPQALDIQIQKVVADSRHVEKGDLFVALSGSRNNGHRFIAEAVKRGAAAIIYEEDNFAFDGNLIPIVQVANSHHVFSELLAKYYENQHEKVRLIGVTGTNGKTTIAYLIHYCLNLFTTCGLIGTIEYRWRNRIQKAMNTTPGLSVFIPLLSEMAQDGISYCVSEVSSHALHQERTAGLRFGTALFTNLTQDHLDYHKHFEGYYAAKRKLFLNDSPPDLRIVNIDDPYGRRLVEEIGEGTISYGIRQDADYRAQNVSTSLKGSEFDVSVRGGRTWHVKSNLSLYHNVYNVLGALSVVSEMGFPLDRVIKHLSNFPGVPGRMERIEKGQPFSIFVDYAHTPDAFQNVFSAIRPLVKGRVFSVFGCGGDRDRGKRPQMGRIAAEFSDAVVLTSDNPRSEDPSQIIDEIEQGILKTTRTLVHRIEDRREAIQYALEGAASNDIVLILGKGHESEQQIGDQIFPFSDTQVVMEFLQDSAKVGRSHVAY